MVTLTLASEPPCAGTEADATPSTGTDRKGAASHGRTRLRAEPRSLSTIPPETWDALATANPWATPFSRWAFHRAWWDAYGGTAHEQTLVVLDQAAPDTAPPVGIVPLMHRHHVEPSDAETHTTMRRAQGDELTPVEPHAKAIFFGASYHADYATVLAAPEDLPPVAEAAVEWLATPGADSADLAPWDVVDLRRLRCGDPAADGLAAAFGRREIAAGWTLNVEREDVCPVVTLPEGVDMDGYLATLGKKERHEIRRKVRRAQSVGDIRLEDSTDPVRDLEVFVDLHQKRWGADGLFPPTLGGEQSRVFFGRLFELFGPDGPLHMTLLSVGGRCIAAGIHLETADGVLYYNAGVDPDARELSPGVLLVYAYVERALANRTRRMDFLRGDEPYKYAWGAVDEPIQRLLVRRRV